MLDERQKALLYYSMHANERLAARDFTRDQIEFAILYGHKEHNTGVVFCQLRRNSLPDYIPPNHPYRRLVGLTVVLCPCGRSIITAYRNEKAFAKDRKKTKYCQKKGYMVACPYCGRRNSD
jgi:hypothetical protein